MKSSECVKLLLLIIHFVQANIYSNVSSVIYRHGINTDNYFGYSVLLQKGNPARVIVGAPKDGLQEVGAVFECILQQPQFSCSKYTIDQKQIRNINNVIFKRNLFGASITGGTNTNDDVMITSPMLTINDEMNFAIGGVFNLAEIKQSDFIKYPANIEDFIADGIYKYGFAEYGFSAHAINSTQFIFGTPGYKHWKGNAYLSMKKNSSQVPMSRHNLIRMRAPRNVQQESNIIIPRDAIDENSLAGYAVSSGNFFKSHVSYVVGMPNAKNMLGQVHIFDSNLNLEQKIHNVNQQVGEHFGGVLATADLNGDGYDDLLIGAPNFAKHNSFDNGKVYVFLSNTISKLVFSHALTGCIICRFGSSITNLGKITLDDHESVAIASPSEAGRGVVRVFVWSEEKQMLVEDSKLEFAKFNAFGFSLSRGVDIDSNNIADFVVGDFKSNSIVLLKAKNVFYYDVVIHHPTLNADKEIDAFSIKICIKVNEILLDVNTEITIDFDARFKDIQQYSKNLRIKQEYCIPFDNINLLPKANRLESLLIDVDLQEENCDTCPVASPTKLKNFGLKVPFQRNCKGESCFPQLKQTLSFDSESIVIGEHKHHDVSLKILNQGDPAYICSVSIKSNPPVPISVIKNKICDDIPCDLNYIINSLDIKYTLDFSRWVNFDSKIDVFVHTNCADTNVNTMHTLNLEYKHDLDIKGGKTDAQYDSENATTFDVSGSIAFIIKNQGPSGLEDATFEIKVPRMSHNAHIIDIYEPVNRLGYELDNIEDFDIPDEYNSASGNDTVATAAFGIQTNALNVIKCNDKDVQCMSITGHIRNLFNGEIVTIEIPTRVNTAEIIKYYKKSFTIEGTISITNQEKTTFVAILNVVDKQTVTESVSIWIIIVSILAGIIILMLFIYALYKFHFFNRTTRERLIELQNQGEEDGVELRNPAVEKIQEDDLMKEDKMKSNESST